MLIISNNRSQRKHNQRGVLWRRRLVQGAVALFVGVAFAEVVDWLWHRACGELRVVMVDDYYLFKMTLCAPHFVLITLIGGIVAVAGELLVKHFTR